MGKKNRREAVVEEDEQQQEFSKELAALMALREEQALEERKGDEDDNEGDDGEERKLVSYNRAAMEQKMEEIHRDLPWIETLTTCDFPLNLQPGEVHDDLKREVAFYENAMQAVAQSIDRFNHLGIPFHRPQDFFAEMMKSDDHMARIKDRLLFETKKMEAFEQRKQRDEQRKFSKQVQALKQKERAAEKKEQIDAVTKWRKNAGNRDGDGQLEDIIAGKRPRSASNQGPNKKRAAKDAKYGFGGSKKMVKKNDAKSTNSLKEFNPKGGAFVRNRTNKSKKPNRPGKQARTQKRAKKAN